jgi:hypothetical protein
VVKIQQAGFNVASAGRDTRIIYIPDIDIRDISGYGYGYTSGIFRTPSIYYSYD